MTCAAFECAVCAGGIPGAVEVAMLVILCAVAVVAYFAVVGLVNSTVIDIDRHQIRVDHGPLPRHREVRLAVCDILQVYVQAMTVGPRSAPLTRVWALNRDGTRLPITPRLFNDDQGVAHQIEKRIEQEAGIVDRPVICPQCGYDMRESLGRCSECGFRFKLTKRDRQAWKRWLGSPGP
jgi:hypothetical protein